MIPSKINQKYFISFQNPAWKDVYYRGPATYTGELDGYDDPETGFEQWYGFRIDGDNETVFYSEKDIICEMQQESANT